MDGPPPAMAAPRPARGGGGEDAASTTSPAEDYGSLLDSYDRAVSPPPPDEEDAEELEHDVFLDVVGADGSREEVCVSVRATETMGLVAERIASSVGRSRSEVAALLELAADCERQTVAEASPSLSLAWRQALTDEDERLLVPAPGSGAAESGAASPREQDEEVSAAARDSLKNVLLAEVSQLEEERAKLSAKLRRAEADLATSSLRCTELQTECLGFEQEFVGMSRDHEELTAAHSRLVAEHRQQSEAMQRLAGEREAMHATVLEMHAATATELSVSKVMEQLEEELYRLHCALGGENAGVDDSAGDESAAGFSTLRSSLLLAGAGAGAGGRVDEDEMAALSAENEELQAQLLQSQEQHALEIERLEAEHSAAMEDYRNRSAAVIDTMSAEHSRVVKHLQEDASYAAAIAAAADAEEDEDEDESGGSGAAVGSASQAHRLALRSLQADHDGEMAKLREEHAEQMAKHTAELEAVSFLVEVPLVKSLAASELRDITSAMASEYYEDENIVEQGDEGDSMYVIQSGRAVVEKDGRPVATYGPRDFFGERVLVLPAASGGGRGATVRADGPVQCLRLGRGPVEELMQRYEHVKAAFEERTRQYEEEDYANSSEGSSTTAGKANAKAKAGKTAGDEGDNRGGGGAGQMAWGSGRGGAGQMEPTVIGTTMMAILVEAVRTVSRAAARAAQLSEVERQYGALLDEHESLSGAYKHKQHEQAAFEAKLSAIRAAEANALAAKSASAEALTTVATGYQTTIDASSAELRSIKAASDAQHKELRAELLAAERQLATMTAEAGQSKAEVLRLEGALEQSKAECASLLPRFESAQAQLATVSASLATAESTCSKQREEITSLQASLSTAQAEQLASREQATAMEAERVRLVACEGEWVDTKQRLAAAEESARRQQLELGRRQAASEAAVRLIRQLMARGPDADRVFAQFDANGDGKITAAELRAGCGQLGLLNVEGDQSDQDGGGATERTMEAMMRFLDAGGDGTIDSNEFRRLGQMKGELDQIAKAQQEAQQEAQSSLAALAQEQELRVVQARAGSEAALAERDHALGRITALDAELKASIADSTALEESLEAARTQLAGMFKAVETQHWGLDQLQEQLAQAERNEQQTRQLLDTSVAAAEEQRSQFDEEAGSLRQQLAKIREEAQLSEVALTATMDVVELCRTKVSASTWREITLHTHANHAPAAAATPTTPTMGAAAGTRGAGAGSRRAV